MEMTPPQARALEIYCESATIENEYKPATFKEIEEKLKEEQMQGSNSAIQRWSKKFNFEGILQAQIQIVVINDEDKTTEHKALDVVVKKKLDALQVNNELTDDCYEIMGLFVKQVVNNYDNTNIIKRDDIKIIKDIATFTGGREDKLLDRIAESGGDKMTSEQQMEEFNDIVLDIEE
ncbi:MAG: hypothetical protein KAQ94_05940 [Arcobacteraceae bacterium]|nr:hypothetical protein [Arcobacteraceae bacterium]